MILFLVVNMNEQFSDDLAAYDEANDLYDDIINFFSLYGVSKTKKLDNNMFATNIEDYTGYPFYVVLGQENSKLRGGFGFIKNNKSKPFILLNILNDNLTKDDLNKLSDIKTKQIIIHEIIHHLDMLRFTPQYRGNSGETQNKINYYNSPSELNTYYNEVLTYAKFLLQSGSIETIKQTYPSVEPMTNMLYDSVFKNVDKYITVKNKKRLKKRISQIAVYLLSQ